MPEFDEDQGTSPAPTNGSGATVPPEEDVYPSELRWFGESWGASVCTEVQRVAVPVGGPCVRCCKPIEPQDSGFLIPLVGGDCSELTYHRDCFLQTVGVLSMPSEPVRRFVQHVTADLPHQPVPRHLKLGARLVEMFKELEQHISTYELGQILEGIAAGMLQRGR